MASKTQLKKQRQIEEAAQRQMQSSGGGGMGGMGGMGDLGSMLGGMGTMPAMPDKKKMMFWKPKGEDGEAMFDVSKFIQIWPIYINSTLTQQQGRRMPKDSCCSDPVVYEMSEICQSYGLRHVIEPFRQYPRSHLKTGRVRVRIFNEDGSFCNEDIKSKKDLMRQMGEKIPSLNSRKKRLEILEQKKASETAQLALEAAKTAGVSNSTGGSSSSKKKGKKGKK